MLICKFASHRSKPSKIQSWIAYLQGIQQKHRDDSEAVQVIEGLLVEAEDWLRGVPRA